MRCGDDGGIEVERDCGGGREGAVATYEEGLGEGISGWLGWLICSVYFSYVVIFGSC